MGAHLADAAFVEDDDAVRLLDRRQTVGDDDARSLGEQPLECFAHEKLRVRVHVRCRLVEDQDLRIVDERASERNELFLPGRERRPAFLNLFFEPVRKRRHPLVQIHRGGGSRHRFVGNTFVAEPNVRRDRAREQVHILKHHTELTPQVFEIPVANIDALDEDPTVLDIVEPHEEAHERRLPRPGVADDRHHLARTDVHFDIAQHPVVALVRERNSLEAHACVLTFRRYRVVGRSDLVFGIEKPENPLGRRHRSLENVELLRKIADGPEELLGVLDKGHEPAERQRAEQDLPAAVPHDESNRDCTQDLHHRVENRVVKDGLDVRFGVLAVELAVLLEFPVFLAEQLHHRHADDVFLDEGVQHGDTGPHLAVDDAHSAFEDHGDGEQRRQNRERHERNTPVEVDEYTHDADEHENVAEDRDHARREQLVERIDVRGNAGDQTSHRILVEIRRVKLLQVRKDLTPHVGHDSLPGHVHDVDLKIRDHELRHEGKPVHERDEIQPLEIASGDVVIDRDFGQDRPDELERGDQQHEDERHRHHELVRRQIREQAPHQAAVVDSA